MRIRLLQYRYDGKTENVSFRLAMYFTSFMRTSSNEIQIITCHWFFSFVSFQGFNLDFDIDLYYLYHVVNRSHSSYNIFFILQFDIFIDGNYWLFCLKDNCVFEILRNVDLNDVKSWWFINKGMNLFSI